MSRIHVNIGSNTGDRAALIERAVAALAVRLDPDGNAEIRLAPLIESEAWGFSSDNRFLNLGLMVDVPGDTDPETILLSLQATEQEISDAPHRQADGSYADRAVDIDLIAVDDKVVDTPELHLRRFVLEPMAALDPSWRHPIFGLTAPEMLSFHYS